MLRESLPRENNRILFFGFSPIFAAGGAREGAVFFKKDYSSPLTICIDDISRDLTIKLEGQKLKTTPTLGSIEVTVWTVRILFSESTISC